jgi:alpha-galactosidase
MKIDPRFSVSIEGVEGGSVLRFVAAREASVEESASALVEASFEELCDLAGMAPEARAPFADEGRRTILCNGWQSWSFGGELGSGERVRRARIMPNIAVYCDGPGPAEARGEVLSRFLTFVRVGEGRLVLASVGSPARATAPVSFRLDRRSLRLSAEIAARGARLCAGELVAEIRIFYREGYFEAKDALRECFRGYGHFERLDFLGSGGKLAPGGYESWYNHYTRIDEAVVSRDLRSIGDNDNLINAYYLRRGKPTVFQIDDGWEAAVGQWEPDLGKFPRGMRALAGEIEAKGMIPGIWIAPLLATRGSSLYREKPEWLLRDAGGQPVPAGFNPAWDGIFYSLDISHPEVEEHLAGIFDTIIEDWGYRYLKLDFLYAGFVGGSSARPAAMARPGAAYEHYDRLMHRLTSRIKDSRGRGVAYLGCGAPLEPSFRHFPLMRVGADTKEKWEDFLLQRVVRHQGRPAAYTNLTHTIGRSLLDGTVFASDPDVVFCRTKGMSLGEAEKELVALVDFALGSQLMFSDDPAEFGEAREVEFTRRIVGLFDELSGGEYGAERLARDVYSLFSRDGRVRGVANLSNRPWAGSGYDSAQALVLHAERSGDSLAFAARSISLFSTRRP